MFAETLADGTIVLDASDRVTVDEVREAQAALAEWRLRGHPTVHVAGVLSAPHDRDDLDAIGRRAVRLNIGMFIAVGQAARVMYLAAEQEGSWDGESLPVPDVDSAYDEVTRLRGDGVVILITGSADGELTGLADRVKEWT